MSAKFADRFRRRTDRSISAAKTGGATRTLKDWIARNVACAPARPALITTSARISYEELNERARRIAAGLAGLGVRKGEIVAVRLPNLPEFVLAWLAINSLGAVMQTLHMAYGKREVERLLQHSAARSKSHPA